MNLELLLWIIALIVSIEIAFILFYRYLDFDAGDWIQCKLLGFLTGVVFIFMNLIAIGAGIGDFSSAKEFFATANYFNLVWMYLIIAGIGLFIFANYKLKKLIDKICGRDKE